MASIRHLLRSEPIKRFQPEYPEDAKKKGITGAVDVVVYINEEGKVYSAVVCKGHPLLRQAALDAAYKDEFEPWRYQGRLTKAMTMLTFYFTLEQKKSRL